MVERLILWIWGFGWSSLVVMIKIGISYIDYGGEREWVLELE